MACARLPSEVSVIKYTGTVTTGELTTKYVVKTGNRLMIDLNSKALNRWACHENTPLYNVPEDRIHGGAFKIPHPKRDGYYFLVNADACIEWDEVIIALMPRNEPLQEPSDGDLKFVARIFFTTEELPHLNYSQTEIGDQCCASIELYSENRENPIKLN